MLSLAAIVLGFVKLDSMPKQALPEFSPTVVEVQTEALGLSAQEVDQLITTPLEQDLLNGVAFVESIRSASVPGLSRIEMTFVPGTEIGSARQVVNERLTQAHGLPNVSKPPQMVQPRSSMSRVMMVRVSSDSRSQMELGLLGRWTIRPRLMSVPGVANVAMWGHQEQQLQVQVDPKRLEAEGVTLDQVISTTGNALWVSNLTFLEASTPGAGGFFETASQRIGVEHAQPITSPEALAKVPIDGVAATNGAVRRLGEVTTIVEGHQPLIGDTAFADGEGLLIVVDKLPGTNVTKLRADLQDMLATISPGLSGVQLDTAFFNPAGYLGKANSNALGVVLVGLGLLALVLVALVKGVGRAIVVLVSSMVALSGAVVVMSMRGHSLNLMVIGGLVLALGVILDDAIASVSATADESAQAEAGAITRATVRTRRPLLYGTAAILLAAVPLFVLDGEPGAFIPEMVIPFLVAIVISVVVGLTLTPVLESIFSRFDKPSWSVLRKPQALYERRVRSFTGSVRPAWVTVAGCALIGVVALALLDTGNSVVPKLQDRDLLISWESAPGTSLAEMKRITKRASSELKGLSGVEDVGAHVGRAILGDQTVGVNSGLIWVHLDDDADYDEMVDSLEAVVGGYPGIDSSVLTYDRDRIDDVLNDEDGLDGSDITVRAFGYRLEDLVTQATNVRDAIAAVKGVDDVTVDAPVMEPTLVVEVDLDKARSYGIKPGDVRRAAATVLAGIEVGNLFEDQKVFEVVVRGASTTGNSLTDVENLLIGRPDGLAPVPLSEVATAKLVAGPSVIRHEGTSLSVDIGVDVGDSSRDDVAGDIHDVLQKMAFPVEYHAEVVGGYDDAQSHRLTFLLVLAAVLVGLLLILQSAFGSWALAATTMVALPGALAGAIVAMLIADNGATVGALTGLLLLVGMAIRNSVLFVQRCHQLEDQQLVDVGADQPVADVVSRVASERFAPTLTTAVSVVAVMLPMLVVGSRAGLEVLSPMATAVIGGMFTVFLFSTVIVPALYARHGRRSAESRERFDLFPRNRETATEWVIEGASQ